MPGHRLQVLVAAGLVDKIKAGATFVSFHQVNGDLEWMKAVHSEVEPLDAVLLTSCSTDGDAGMFMMSGPEGLVKQLGPLAATAMEGRGGGKGRFQGKVKNAGSDARTAALAAIEAKLQALDGAGAE